jgi:hypothetical protein
VILPDGSTVPRLPGFRRWIWDDEFCGSIDFRWQPGTSDLPAHVLGNIGYAVVPWKRGRGYAKRALGLLLREVRSTGLTFVELTTDPDNLHRKLSFWPMAAGSWNASKRRPFMVVRTGFGFALRCEFAACDEGDHDKVRR